MGSRLDSNGLPEGHGKSFVFQYEEGLTKDIIDDLAGDKRSIFVRMSAPKTNATTFQTTCKWKVWKSKNP